MGVEDTAGEEEVTYPIAVLHVQIIKMALHIFCIIDLSSLSASFMISM